MAFVLGVSGVLLLYNNLTNLLSFPSRLYVPANLALVLTLVGAARARGLSWADVGLSHESVGPGLRWGGAIAAAVGAGLALALVLPGAERFLADKRVAGIGGGEILYRVLVRIPLGTALVEEVAFRGVLYGAWARERSTVAAVVGSSIVFGLWHIGPAIELLRINEVAEGPAARAGAVAGAVAATTLGGALFCLLRVRTRGILGPVLGHFAANSLSTLAAFVH